MSTSEAAAGSAGSSSKERKFDLQYLIRAFVKYNASDLHLRRKRPPLYRIHGKLLPATMPELSEEMIQKIILPIIPKTALEKFEQNRQIDFTFETDDSGRFRCNVFYFMNSLGAVLRRIPAEVPVFESLRAPAILKELVQKPRGLLLITGATGSGKSTTMASLIQFLNETQRLHIVTIEDPVEFVFQDKKSVITQRELGCDFHALNDALTSCMRQDPDVIVVGEMRDYRTFQTALTAAETGHLVISTLHTNDAKSALDRILDMFPAEQKNQARVQLASSLIGISAQQLVVKSDGSGRILSSEVMIKSPSIENCIRKATHEEIPQLIASSGTYYKMQTMNMDLESLVRDGSITLEEAISCSNNPDDLKLRFSGIDRKDGYDIRSEDVSMVIEEEDDTSA